jgi:hypothetical protein
MKCKSCKKHMAILTCGKCETVYCHNCIQMETHKCKGASEAKIMELERLEKSLPKVVAAKI